MLLLRVLERDAGLRPLQEMFPVLFFALPAPGTAARILEANGGNVEPLIGFVQREFTLYGYLALLVLDVVQRHRWPLRLLLTRGITAGAAACVWIVVRWANQFSAAAGPGTTLADA